MQFQMSLKVILRIHLLLVIIGILIVSEYIISTTLVLVPHLEVMQMSMIIACLKQMEPICQLSYI